ncbi:MAG: 3'-5' exonuclease, partial [Actinomycetota bacterium]
GEEQGVTFMTLHNAKGLEFQVVFIVGMEEGVFPHMRSLTDPDQLEEERRLAYVGITRAKERLYVLHAWARSLWGGTNYNPPSRFLKELPDDLVQVVGERNATSPPRRAGSPGAPRGPQTDPHAFKIGQTVEHAKWGKGTIIDINRSAIGLEATIHFPAAGGDKRLDLTLAPLTPVA